MNRIITIGRQFGSGGRELGRRVAQALNIAYYDREVITEIVKRTQLSAYRNIRKAGIIAISLEEGDELAWVQSTGGADEMPASSSLAAWVRSALHPAPGSAKKTAASVKRAAARTTNLFFIIIPSCGLIHL